VKSADYEHHVLMHMIIAAYGGDVYTRAETTGEYSIRQGVTAGAQKIDILSRKLLYTRTLPRAQRT
jgi:hypothetical protein